MILYYYHRNESCRFSDISQGPNPPSRAFSLFPFAGTEINDVKAQIIMSGVVALKIMIDSHILLLSR
jgi:hypothetical protein